MSVRSLTVVKCLAVAGILGAVAVPTVTFTAMNRAEDAAERSLHEIVRGQRAFRTAAGQGGYATTLESLTTPCPGHSAAAVRAPAMSRYTFAVRPAHEARVVGVDCHGRPTTTDFYASARPLDAFAGRLAFAVTARGRLYAFFDGIPPTEVEMGGRGLAVARDGVPAFKIP